VLREEFLRLRGLRLVHPLELGHLDDPAALHDEQRILVVEVEPRIRVPLAAQDLDRGGLLRALLALEDQHVVDTAPGLEHARHGAHHPLHADELDVPRRALISRLAERRSRPVLRGALARPKAARATHRHSR
jgi:hypothetical protein